MKLKLLEMKIIKKSTILELPETLEEGSTKIICDKPYNIERIEKNNKVIWLGYNTNWKLDKSNNQWYYLVKMNWVPCNIPEYEKLYNKIKINSV